MHNFQQQNFTKKYYKSVISAKENWLININFLNLMLSLRLLWINCQLTSADRPTVNNPAAGGGGSKICK